MIEDFLHSEEKRSSEDFRMSSEDEDMNLFLHEFQPSPKTPNRHANLEAGAMLLDSPATLPRHEIEDNGSDCDLVSEPSPSICTRASVRKALCKRPRHSEPCVIIPEIREASPDTVIMSSPTSIDIREAPEETKIQTDYLPLRMSVEKLELLTRGPAAAAGIRTLTVNLAPTEFTTPVKDSNMFLQPAFLGETARIKESSHIEAVLDDDAPLESLVSLRRALRRLENLKVLRLSWNNNSWTDPTLDPVGSLEVYRSKISNIQQYVLHILSESSIRLHELVIEPFMLSDIALSSSLDHRIMEVFGSISILSLDLLYLEEPFLQDDLEYFLSFLSNLKELKLRVIPSDWAPEEIDFFPATHLKHLESLDLRCMHFRLDSFASFLSTHAKTIKHLSLVSLDGLSPPLNPCVVSWDLIFLLINAKFENLESAFINGVFRQEGLGSQVFYQDSEKENIGDFQDRRAMKADIMEKFLVDGGKYPEPEWQSIVE